MQWPGFFVAVLRHGEGLYAIIAAFVIVTHAECTIPREAILNMNKRKRSKSEIAFYIISLLIVFSMVISLLVGVLAPVNF